METNTVVILIGLCTVVFVAAILFWRYVWFYRNPERIVPQGDHVVCPADGTVVYAKRLDAADPVIVIKKGVEASINDIVREDSASPKILIGIFMSPFDVHYNRAPLAGVVQFVRHYPARTRNFHMTAMHVRTLLKRIPYEIGSLHILENERTVTRIAGLFKGSCIGCYVVQIAGGSVSGIDSHIHEGDSVSKGQIFGMIRIGSQVDVVVPALPDMRVRVRPGDKVRAGETILID
ncbi:MAG: phosphatidylserine decarboxylase [Thermodesulfobacteriota bacterium]